MKSEIRNPETGSAVELQVCPMCGRGPVSRPSLLPPSALRVPVSLPVVLAVLVVFPAAELASAPPDARRAFGYLQKVCRLGPRPSGSMAMQRQQRLIVDHFSRLGGRVRFQPFETAHPLSGRAVRMNNLVVTWHPEAKRRVLLACHYDTRPFPDLDRKNPRGRFIGANDGASGVALLMELGHHLKDRPLKVGIDFVFFDAEEFLFARSGRFAGEFFLGSKHFARQYRDRPPAYRYTAGVVVDMVGDRDLQLYMEKKSLSYAREVTEGIWATARRLRVRSFRDRPKPKHDIDDDHVPLNTIAKIPTCDIIDFDFPHWHTTRDTPAACSGRSLVDVGRVLLAWLDGLPAGGPMN